MRGGAGVVPKAGTNIDQAPGQGREAGVRIESDSHRGSVEGDISTARAVIDAGGAGGDETRAVEDTRAAVEDGRRVLQDAARAGGNGRRAVTDTRMGRTDRMEAFRTRMDFVDSQVLTTECVKFSWTTTWYSHFFKKGNRRGVPEQPNQNTAPPQAVTEPQPTEGRQMLETAFVKFLDDRTGSREVKPVFVQDFALRAEDSDALEGLMVDSMGCLQTRKRRSKVNTVVQWWQLSSRRMEKMFDLAKANSKRTPNFFVPDYIVYQKHIRDLFGSHRFQAVIRYDKAFTQAQFDTKEKWSTFHPQLQFTYLNGYELVRARDNHGDSFHSGRQGTPRNGTQSRNTKKPRKPRNDICTYYNTDRKCPYDVCEFLHVCLKCAEDHKLLDCPQMKTMNS